MSNGVATDNNLLPILTQNQLSLYEIAKSKGNDNEALRYFERYTTLWDSLFNAGNLDEINRIERIHETAKIDKQIEQLTFEQLIRERTISLQRIIQLIMLVAIVALSALFANNISKRRRLNAAYKALMDKNLEQIESRRDEKDKKVPHLLDAPQEELLEKILTVMEDTSVVCDAKFSINVLAVLVQSNQQYVSHIINNGLSKNFRSFRNGYRIREAQRLFAEPDSSKFTIESVAQSVGFRSRSAFREAFMEVTGVTPTFYVRSLRDKSRKISE
jgi:AraC-like DNA-binding protein